MADVQKRGWKDPKVSAVRSPGTKVLNYVKAVTLAGGCPSGLFAALFSNLNRVQNSRIAYGLNSNLKDTENFGV